MMQQVNNSISRRTGDPRESPFEAVERELGLKLVKQTRMYPVIVVDHVEEKPVVTPADCHCLARHSTGSAPHNLKTALSLPSEAFLQH